MAYNFVDQIIYHGKKANFDRDAFPTIAAMASYNENYLPDTFIAVCYEDGKLYVFNRNNPVDNTTGKWRALEGSNTGKLSRELVVNTDLGFIKEGKTYAKDSSLEQIIIDMLSGKKLQEDGFYYGTSDTRDIVSLYQFTNSTKATCNIVANNQYVIFAVKKELGEINIQDSNGWNYNSEFDKTEITYNGILYYVYIGKYKITTSGFEYRLSFN